MKSKEVFFSGDVLTFNDVELLLSSDVKEESKTGDEDDWEAERPGDLGDTFILLFSKVSTND